MKRNVSWVVAVLVLLAAIAYVVWPKFRIVGQVSLPVAKPFGSSGQRGYTVESMEDLRFTLTGLGVDFGQLKGMLETIDFEKEFVFIVENGQLKSLDSGSSSLGYAVVTQASTPSVGISIVRGTADRSFKVVNSSVKQE